MSLVELMVSLTIGLFLMAGAMAVFISAMQTGARKTEADQTLETFRFTQFVLSRVVRQASAVEISDAADKLVLTVPKDVDGCIGEPIEPKGSERQNTFRLNGSALQCTAGSTTQTLIENVHSIKFTYGVDSNNDNRVSQDQDLTRTEYVEFNKPPTWASVSSVLVTLQAKRGTESGLTTSFVLTLRRKALSL